MVCPACGETNVEESRYCSACGFELRPSGASRASGAGVNSAGSGIDLGQMASASAEEPPTATIEPGSMIRERYRIEKLLGQGGMGSVYLAVDTTINRNLAIKFINPELWQRRAAFLRFIREANVCLDLTHNHIIRVYNLDQWQGQTFLTMEYLNGFSLRALLYHLKKQKTHLDWARSRGILRQVLDAVEYAHSRGVVHRDLKPGNIMLAKEPNGAHRAVVMDFGLARRDEDNQEARTRMGSSLGTPEYMAPEQAQSAAQVDGRADLFSIGAIAYEMFTGRVPRGHLEPPSQLAEDLPVGIDQWVFKALEHDPDKRFQSAREMGGALRELGRARSSSSIDDVMLAPVDTPSDSSADAQEAARPSSEKRSADSSVLEMGSALADLSSPDEFLQSINSSSSDLFGAPSAPAGAQPRSRPSSLSFHLSPAVFKIAALIAVVGMVGWGAMSLYGKLTSEPRIPRPPSDGGGGMAISTPASPGADARDYVEGIQGLNMRMVWVPEGQFTMGNTASAEDLTSQYGMAINSFLDEYPAGTVEMSGFWMSATEVTCAQYKTFLQFARDPAVRASGPFSDPAAPAQDNMPVTHVTWAQASAFCQWLSSVTGKFYRLPSEAQWEYACRAGSDTQFCFGDLPGPLGEYAWFLDNADDSIRPVGLKRPNDFGLYDMHGNVWEWCRDYYAEDSYSSRQLRDPVYLMRAPYRVARGGSYSVAAQFCRCTVRSRQTSSASTDFLGFRVACLTAAPEDEAVPAAAPGGGNRAAGNAPSGARNPSAGNAQRGSGNQASPQQRQGRRGARGQ